MDKLKGAANFLKSKFQTDELDEKLAEAVSEQNWQASTQLLHQIANASYNYDHQQKIITFIWDKLKSKNWKKVLKTLHLIDFLIKYGPFTLIDNLKENVYEFRKLDDYTCQADGIDRGQSVRKQAKVVLILLTDDQLLNDERAKAKQIKDRMSSVIGSGAYFGQFSSDTRTSGQSNIKGSNYGSISSQSYKYAPGASSKGTSFGQTVMRQLHQKKKTFSQSQSQKAPPSTLNLQTMLQKKSEKQGQEAKKSFNSLSMKLVKPADKKPAQKGPPSSTNKPLDTKQVQSKPKQATKVDIFDLDITTPVKIEQPQQSLADPFDLLGSNSSTLKKSQGNANNINLFEAIPASSLAYNPPSSSPPPATELLMGISTSPSQPATIKPYNQPYKIDQKPNQNFNFNSFGPNSIQGTTLMGVSYGNGAQSQLSQPQSHSTPFSLSLNNGKGGQKAKDEGSLIDFSNFREQLSSLSGGEKKDSITAGWNW